ncbi:Cna B-type domain-containing protein [Dysosmobacter sp.]|uniref:Cna B-type domain-containing protein n=1 Tax=Dysosmobacter sp. TaxID=2591382 RepID=UPI002A8DA539|nr:Cna B-type domain-containing protein [Dysosmobacter sp.]MDY3282018.1 Cna B-type domain-containing protein [Dysosmobacter sp.]
MSAFLAAVMSVSLLQVGTMALGTETDAQVNQRAKQIQGNASPVYYTYNAESGEFVIGTNTNPVVKNNEDPAKTKVTISKEIFPTGTENEFDIALKVKTNEAIEQSTKSPDAAVVLVIDTSDSMRACATCGEHYIYNDWGGYYTYYHSKDCVYCTSHKNLTTEVATEHTRLAAAKAEAANFLNTYAGFTGETYKDPNATRYVAVVEFNGNASMLNFGNRINPRYWFELHGSDEDATKANLTTVTNRINSLGTNYSTNPDAGLMYAEWLLDANQGGKAVSSVDNKFVVLLTDGQPNANTGDISRSRPMPEKSGYTMRNNRNYDNPARRAFYIRNTLDTTFYSICFDAGDNVSQWMTEFSNKCVAATNANQLSLAFKEIIIRMMLAVDAWKVTDPMGEHISLVSVSDLNTHANNAVTYDANGLNWNLRMDLASEATTIVDKNGAPITNYQPGMDCTITYHLRYRVKLNVAGLITALEAANPTATNEKLKELLEDQWNLTNGETRLDYYLTKKDSNDNTQYVDDDGNVIADGTDKMLSMHFKVPAVKGYAALPLSFTKVGADGKQLAGAKFEVANAANTWSEEAVSDANGLVTFAKPIPSGDSYVLSETTVPDGYEAVENTEFTLAYGQGAPSFRNGTVTDPLHIEKIDVTVTKTWLKPADESAATSIKLTLLQNGQVYDAASREYTDVIVSPTNWDTGSTADLWKYTFHNLPEKDAQGNLYEYTVEEESMVGWTTSYDAGNPLHIINTASGNTIVSVTKDWILPAGMTGSEVTVKLLANGEETGQTCKVSPGRTEFFGLNPKLPTYDSAGQRIEYSVQEVPGSYQQAKAPAYTKAGTVEMWTLTNTVAQEKTSVSGSKIWRDGNAAAHDAVTVELYADGQPTGTTARLSDANNWEYEFKDLDRYAFTCSYDGEGNVTEITAVRAISYTVRETDVPDGYAVSYEGSDVVNTRTGTVSFTASKVWGADVEDAQHGEVSVILYANGAEKDTATTVNGSYTFESLPKYDAKGGLISYSVREARVPGGYTVSYSKVTTDNNGNYAQTITNTPNAQEDTTTVTVHKNWKQPADVAAREATFRLYDGDTGELLNTATILGNTTYSFRNLDKYKEIDGKLKKINYVVEEDKLAGYDSGAEQNGNTWTFTNVIKGTTDITVTKSWVDPDPTDRGNVVIDVEYYDAVNQEWVKHNETITIENGKTTGELKGLPAYDSEGQRIDYRISEQLFPGYTASVTGGLQNNGKFSFSLVNTINPADTRVPVSKTWIDGGTPAADRPDVTISVLQTGMEGGLYPNAAGTWSTHTLAVKFYEDNGTVKADTLVDGAVTATADAEVSADGSTYTAYVTVPQFSQDLTRRYVYTAEEYTVPSGYSKAVSGTAVTNRRSGTLEPLTITKYWTDPAGTDRPDITLVLTGTDGSVRRILVSDDGGVTATLNGEALQVAASGSTWSIKVPDLPEFDAGGARITYTLDEESVPGYTRKTVEGQPFAIRNVIEQKSDVTAGAEKVWVMDTTGHYKPAYPDSISVALFRDGQMVAGSQQTVKRTAGNTYPIETYRNLNKYASDGHAYDYEVRELDATGAEVRNGGTVSFGENNDYTVTYQNGVITNTYAAPARYLYVVECHYTHTAYDGTLVSSYVVTSDLKSETESRTVTANPGDYKVCGKDGLTYSFDPNAANPENVTSVALAEENHLYKLVLSYVLVDDEPAQPGNPGSDGDKTTDVIVKKVWKGDTAEDRPDSITVRLLKDGKAYADQELSADNNWKCMWVDLSDSAKWTVEEIDVPDGYTSSVSVRNSTWTITNTYDGSLPVIPDEPVPGGDQPGGGSSGGTNPGDGDDEFIIPDTEVPTGDKTVDPPKTGDAMALWAAAAALSGLGLGWMTINGRKRKEEET